MSMLPDHGGSSRSEESHGSFSQKVDETKNAELDCGLNADSGYVTHKGIFFKDVLLHLRSVAMDPCSKVESFKKYRESQRQILNARKALFSEKPPSLSNAESPQKRRKSDELLQENVTASKSKSPSKKPRVQSLTDKKSCSLATSSSCLISPSESAENSDHFHPSLNSLTPYRSDAVDGANPSNKEVMTLFESDGSVSGSNPLSTIKPILRTSERAIKLLMSGNNVPKRQAPDRPRNGDPFVNRDGSVNSLISASKKSRTCQKPPRSLNFDKRHERMPIPVGPRFQADIPDWTGLPNRDISLNSEVNADESEKWLGTIIWPIEKNAEVCRKSIGKGRPATCSCRSPGSTNCIKHHITEKRQKLQLDLGSAFFSWKFDEMGEQVSKSWTPNEQKSFKVLVNSNPVSKKMSFWKPALESFPTKTKESIVSYYFNVFVPSRMCRQTRLAAPKGIDSDDDEFNESIGGLKDSKKAKYLTGLR